jgi:hypothetical protein
MKLSITALYNYAESRYDECHLIYCYAECHYAECRYAEYRGAICHFCACLIFVEKARRAPEVGWLAELGSGLAFKGTN